MNQNQKEASLSSSITLSNRWAILMELFKLRLNLMVVVSSVLGYFIGTLAAGFFLAMDLLEPYLPGSRADSLDALATNPDQKTS